jgi:hypothetical protein
MGETALWGRPPPTRFYMEVGETAPNAVLYGGGGNRPQRGFIWRWGKPPPTRFYMEVGETAPNAVLYGGDRKGYRWLLRGY